MVDPLEFVPGYVSPLTDKEHARIGRIAVLWGQIEHFVEKLLCYVSGLSWAELSTIGVADKPIGAKVEFLKAARKRLKDSKLEERVAEFCSLIDETKTSRNHVFHGIWGWRGDLRSKSVFPAARKTSQPSQPFKSSQLAGLEKKLCKCSRLGLDLAMHFWGDDYQNVRIKLNRFIHHAGKDVPQWLRQWSARNPLNDAVLDRNAKAGQLPRPAAPFPRK